MFKLRNGMAVVENNELVPEASRGAHARRTAEPSAMKSFTDLFIRRPVLALVVNLVILIAGFQAIRSLNVRQYPRSDNAAVTVTTVYVGASADLVRGFITTPLERAIAAADGIDYIESSSKLGLSTITVRLKLNYDPTKALAEISSKVDQVRNDLPPEAEVPIINIDSADSQFASAYLSFTSDILEANQITDYLVRVVQPRLSALEGVQRADILGGRTFAMRIWLKPDRMAALNINPDQIREALARQQLPLRRRPHQRLAGAGQPHRQHRPALRRGVPQPGRPPVRRQAGPAARRGRCGAGRGGLRVRSAVRRRTGRVHGHLAAAQRQLAGRHQAGARRDGARSRRSCPPA